MKQITKILLSIVQTIAVIICFVIGIKWIKVSIERMPEHMLYILLLFGGLIVMSAAITVVFISVYYNNGDDNDN